MGFQMGDHKVNDSGGPRSLRDGLLALTARFDPERNQRAHLVGDMAGHKAHSVCRPAVRGSHALRRLTGGRKCKLFKRARCVEWRVK